MRSGIIILCLSTLAPGGVLRTFVANFTEELLHFIGRLVFTASSSRPYRSYQGREFFSNGIYTHSYIEMYTAIRNVHGLVSVSSSFYGIKSFSHYE